MPKVDSSISLDWNLRNLGANKFTASYGLCIEQIHLARYVQLVIGSLGQIRSRNEYNVFYRALGNEYDNICFQKNDILFSLFLLTASFPTYKQRWSEILNFLFRTNFNSDQYRLLLQGFRDAYIGRSSPYNMKRSLQRMLQLDENKVDVFEFWKDSGVMGFFTTDWLFRNDAILDYIGASEGTIAQNTPDLLRNPTGLASYAVNALVNHQIVITSGLGIGQVRTIIANDNTFFTVAPAWIVVPDSGDTFNVALIGSKRNDVDDRRPTPEFYFPFGLSNYGFQVWVSVDTYLNVISFIDEIVQRIKPAYARYSIAYILHRNEPGSLAVALTTPSLNPLTIQVGTGDPSWDPFNPTPAGGETALYAPVATQLALINYIDGNEKPSTIPTDSLEVSGFFNPGIATSERITEVGLFAEDGTLLEYQAFAAINKEAVDAFIWKFRLKYASL